MITNIIIGGVCRAAGCSRIMQEPKLLFVILLSISISILAWLIVHWTMKPKLKISKCIAEHMREGKAIFRIKIENAGWFGRCFDLQLYGRIVIKYRDKNGERRRDSFMVEVKFERSPIMERRKVLLKKEQCSGWCFDLELPDGTRKSLADKFSLTNEDKINFADIIDVASRQQNEEFKLLVFALSTHSFSGVRTVEEAVYVLEYNEKNGFVSGQFKPESFDIA